MRRVLTGVAALASFALAAALLLVAADVARWRAAIVADDVRYRVVPEAPDLWRPDELIGRRLATRVVGIDDDVAYRNAVRALRLGRIDEPFVTDPRLALLRTEAHARLTTIVESRGDPVRRAVARNLRAVLAVASASSEYEDREALVRGAMLDLERAIALDPANEDAKHNLELLLQRRRDVSLAESAAGSRPSRGGQGAKGAGASDPQSGY